MRLKCPLWFESSDEALEGETARTERELGLAVFVEEASGAVDAILAYVDVLFNGIDRSSLAESGGVEDPTAASDSPNGNRLVDGRTEHFVDVELARRFVERVLRSEKVMTPHKLFAVFVDVHPFDLENVQIGQFDVGWQVMRRTRHRFRFAADATPQRFLRIGRVVISYDVNAIALSQV